MQVNGRIVVDAESYFDNNYGPRPSFDPISTRYSAPHIEVEDGGHVDYDSCDEGDRRHPPPPRRSQGGYREQLKPWQLEGRAQRIMPTNQKKLAGE